MLNASIDHNGRLRRQEQPESDTEDRGKKEQIGRAEEAEKMEKKR